MKLLLKTRVGYLKPDSGSVTRNRDGYPKFEIESDTRNRVGYPKSGWLPETRKRVGYPKSGRLHETRYRYIIYDFGLYGHKISTNMNAYVGYQHLYISKAIPVVSKCEGIFIVSKYKYA